MSFTAYSTLNVLLCAVFHYIYMSADLGIYMYCGVLAMYCRIENYPMVIGCSFNGFQLLMQWRIKTDNPVCRYLTIVESKFVCRYPVIMFFGNCRQSAVCLSDLFVLMHTIRQYVECGVQ